METLEYLNYAFGDEVRGLIVALTVLAYTVPAVLFIAALNNGGKDK